MLRNAKNSTIDMPAADMHPPPFPPRPDGPHADTSPLSCLIAVVPLAPRHAPHGDAVRLAPECAPVHAPRAWLSNVVPPIHCRAPRGHAVRHGFALLSSLSGRFPCGIRFSFSCPIHHFLLPSTCMQTMQRHSMQEGIDSLPSLRGWRKLCSCSCKNQRSSRSHSRSCTLAPTIKLRS